jgi:hypothetical protein
MPVYAGDTVVLRAKVNRSVQVGRFRASVVDQTTHTSCATGKQRFIGGYASTAWIAVGQNDEVVGAIPDFGKIQWTKEMVNGSILDSYDSQAFNLIKNPGHPKTLISTSPFSPPGLSFKNTWVRGS